MIVALVMSSATVSRASVAINKETFPDDVFRAYVSSEDIDIDQDRQLDDDELWWITWIDVRKRVLRT